MSTKSAVAILASFIACGVFLCTEAEAAPADAGPAPLGHIQQGRIGSFGGGTLFELQGIECPGPFLGSFALPNDPKQSIQVQLLIAAKTLNKRVIVAYETANCSVNYIVVEP
jgi:hypothetical protein